MMTRPAHMPHGAWPRALLEPELSRNSAGLPDAWASVAASLLAARGQPLRAVAILSPDDMRFEPTSQTTYGRRGETSSGDAPDER